MPPSLGRHSAWRDINYPVEDTTSCSAWSKISNHDTDNLITSIAKIWFNCQLLWLWHAIVVAWPIDILIFPFSFFFKRIGQSQLLDQSKCHATSQLYINRSSWSKHELRPILTCHTRSYATQKTFRIRKFMTHPCKKIQNDCKFRVHEPSYIFLETFLQNSWINATHMTWFHQYIKFYEPLSTLWMYCATECKQQCHTSICHHYSTAPPPV